MSNPDRPPSGGDEHWSGEVHQVLREVARRHLRREGPDITLQPTDLVHEAYLRVCELEMPFVDRQHFVRLTSTFMRRVLVEHARKKGRDKRGGRPRRVTLQTRDLQGNDEGLRVLELDLLLDSLAKADARKAKIAEVYYFAGLTQDETAAALEISPATVVRELRFIRSWIHAQLAPAAGQAAP